MFYTPSEHSTDIRVTRRHSGRVLAYMSKKIGLPSLITTVECLAVVWALRFARECGFSSFILEGDYEIVCKPLRSEDELFTPFGHLRAKAKSLAESSRVVNFFDTHRQGNSVTYNFVRHVKG